MPYLLDTIDPLAERVGIFRNPSESRVFPGNPGSSTQRNGTRCVELLGMILSNFGGPGKPTCPTRFTWTRRVETRILREASLCNPY